MAYTIRKKVSHKELQRRLAAACGVIDDLIKIKTFDPETVPVKASDEAIARVSCGAPPV